MARLLFVVVGYVFGLFNTSLAIGKLAGFDIRKHGSGNTGTTNMVRVMGAKMGFAVLIGDAFKAIIPMLVMAQLFGESGAYAPALVKAYTGFGAVLGHNYPFYTGFRGGKGIATSLGVAFAFHPAVGIFGMICFAIPFFTLHYASLCSLIMITVMFGALSVMTFLRAGVMQALSAQEAIELYVIFGLMIFLAFFRHRTNIEKLLKGQERKTYLSKKDRA